MEYNVISSDGHVDLHFLPGDLFTSNAPAAWRDRMPRIVESEKGLDWVADGKFICAAMSRNRGSLTPKNEARLDKIASTGFFEDAMNGSPHPTILDLRLKDMDLDGIDAEVVYGLTFIGGRLLGVRGSEGRDLGHEALTERVSIICRIYNDWAADFFGQCPERLAGLACLPNHTPEAAAEELRRAAKLGLRGGNLEVQGSAKPIYYDDWDVVWRASDECNMPISFHLLGANPRKPNPEDAGDERYGRTHRSLGMVLGQLEGTEFVSSIILSGACERYPGFKFVLGECGVTWLAFILDRLDHECADFPGLTMKPSDYWRRSGTHHLPVVGARRGS